MTRGSPLYAAALLLISASAGIAADVTGKWTAEFPGREGSSRVMMFTFKTDGSKLNGSMLFSGGRGPSGRGGRSDRGGPPPPPPSGQEIVNGRINGDKVYFEVHRSFNSMTVVSKYEGTVSGQELKLTMTRPGMDGTPQTSELVLHKTN
jgi:hypothetical protein